MLLQHLPVDRERTPWPCKAGRFARPEDAMLNYSMIERYGIIIPTRFRLELRDYA